MRSIAIRRIFAYLIDYAVIVMYIICLTLVSVYLVQSNLSPSAELTDKVRGHAIGFITLTLPVWTYFTILEASGKNATLGKLALGLSVRSEGNGSPNFRAIALRNFIKFVPWELAHASIWYVKGRPFLDEMPTLNLVICISALFIAFIYVFMLFLGNGQTLYDRISRTVVVKKQAL